MEPEAAVADLDRRRATLQVEISDWLGRALASPGGLGLHRSQLGQIQRALDSLMAARESLVAACRAKAEGVELADAYIEALEEIVGAGELWRIYQTGIEQHATSPFKDFVHQATLIAAELIAPALAKMAEDSRPAPAMVYLDPALSPAAAGTQTVAGDSGFAVRRFRALRLPVPLVLLPADQSRSFWSLTHLAHEVGHNLDQELGRVVGANRSSLTRDLRERVIAALTEAEVPGPRIPLWRRWTEELLADLFGLSMGGPAFGSALSHFMLPLAQASRFATLTPGTEAPSRAPHPPPVLRHRVLLELMRLEGSQPMVAMGATLAQDWKNIAEPAYLAEFAADLPTVAGAIWEFRTASGGLLRELAPFAPDARFGPLVDFLAGTTPNRPSARLPENFPRMQVAFAAELARRATSDDLQKVHDRALAFATAIPSPQYAAGAKDSLKTRAEFLRFSTTKETP